MRNPAALRWMGAAVFVSIVIAAIAYFLMISPTMDATAEARERAEQEQARIDQLEIQLAGLRADFAKLDEYKAELAELQVQLPTELLLNELTRQIDGIAVQTDVFVVGMAPGFPYEVFAPTVTQPAPAPDDDADADEATDDETSAPPAPTGPTLPAGFYAVPVAITLLAEYEPTLEFLETLQLDNPRLVLVNAVSTTVQDEQGAQGGRPATTPEFLETQVGFLAYVLLDSEGAVVPPVEGAELPPLPSGSGNPFAPLQ